MHWATGWTGQERWERRQSPLPPLIAFGRADRDQGGRTWPVWTRNVRAATPLKVVPTMRSRADGLIRSAGPLMVIGGLVLVLVAVLALREVASLVVPVMFGLFIALTAWPMVGALERRGVRHPVALAGTIVVVLAVGFVAACVAALSVGELAVADSQRTRAA